MPAARGVHHQHARAHLGEGGAAEHAGGVLGARHVDGDGVGALEQRVEGDQLDVEIGDLLLRQVGVVRDHLHAEPARAIGHDAADVAEAEHAQRAVVELHAHELGLLPLARLHGGRGLRDVARERDQQRDGVLGGRDVVAARGVHHHDAARGGGGDVDVVDADPGAPDHAQLARPRRSRRRSPWCRCGSRAPRRRRSPSSRSPGGRSGPIVDLDAARAFEDLEPLAGERIRYENPGHGLPLRRAARRRRRRERAEPAADPAQRGPRSGHRCGTARRTVRR